ncbi:MAG: aldehyde dehydrogenase family protein, partial [Mariprofundaceae bacterium]
MNPLEHFPLMIPEVVDAEGEPLTVRSPYDDQAIATVATANAAGVEQALKNASCLFENRSRKLSVQRRIAILERSIILMQEHAEELALLAANEGGKPLLDSRIEMIRCIDSIRICIDTLRNNSTIP